MLTLLSINTWQWSLRSELIDFLASVNSKVDIFCFQEVHEETPATDEKARSNLKLELEELLVDHKPAGFAPFWNRRWGVFTMVREDIVVESVEEIWIHGHLEYVVPEGRHKSEMARSMLATILDVPVYGRILICNVHGYNEPIHDKADTPERISQSRKILEHVGSVGLPAIIMWDFNLRADTGSVEMFERAGFRNLIKEYEILSTRPTETYHKPIRDADFVFMSPEFRVRSFEVPDIAVSDHCPLVLEIE